MHDKGTKNNLTFTPVHHYLATRGENGLMKLMFHVVVVRAAAPFILDNNK